MSQTARTNKDNGWIVRGDGAISGDIMNCAARIRILADRLAGEDRVEANSIASAVADGAMRVNGLEQTIIR
ncbi:hypothetical protein BerOc1_02967 [Pseudodesulfovibrio hydrargyri]|uniref:Uncharacterized protein n=1 Tax=Pseudodesulfovibrio hydrargyri TaxID=2125990 RepID=A0A1J5MWX0_9BACT|nr:hypothetical protein [Pseudodesulfovibrio hydrargyri]OIQ51022.1 hypothetical protein BerOc1_02967 [Pseudodesulfovibrio hydrargyri]